ncbi:hypothetical protein ACLOJK_037592 [Asimina triloba]
MLGVNTKPEKSEASVSASKYHSQDSQTDHTVPDLSDPSKETSEDHREGANDQNVKREPRIMSTDTHVGKACKGEVTTMHEETINPPMKPDKVNKREFLYELLEDRNAVFVEEESKKRNQIQLEPGGVIVEDVTNDMPIDVHTDPEVVPYVILESITLESESEDVKEDDCRDKEDDCRDKDSSVSDAAIAEMEAGIYGLQDGPWCNGKGCCLSEWRSWIWVMESNLFVTKQGKIIKNADLEELRELGSGTFGTVYHGKWRGTDVAIKRLKRSCFAGRLSEQERLSIDSSESAAVLFDIDLTIKALGCLTQSSLLQVKDFWREAQILSKLHHPNVVAFYGVVPDGDGGTLGTVTEFMVNGSLKEVLSKKDKPLDRRKRLIIAMDAAFGMEYLHSKDIVHFDLKCENLLVNMRDPHRPICKVGDFGLSRIKRNTLVSGGVRGTLPWMAPELLDGSSNRVSEKVDVFSFGIALWEILTGEEPYANMHCGEVIGGIVNNNLRPPIPKRCNSKWRELMEDCWSSDPESRPSFTAITGRLRMILMELTAKRRDPPNG